MSDVWSGKDWFVVTPTDNTDIGDYKAIYVGTGGDLAVRKTAGATPVIIPVPSGGLLPVKPIYSIDSTNTDADDIIKII